MDVVTKTTKAFVLVKISQKTRFFDGTELAAYKNEIDVLLAQTPPNKNDNLLIKYINFIEQC